MPASLRELRQRRAAVTTTKKVTRAMELIASSRIVKAQQRAQQATPYARELTRAVSAVATDAPEIDHPLTTQVERPAGGGGAGDHLRPRSGRCLLLERCSSRPPSCGSCSSATACASSGSSPVARRSASPSSGNFEIHRQWEGFSDSPTYAEARDIADALIESFLKPTDEGGVDEIHIVYTRFVSMLTQTPTVIRLLPLEVVAGRGEDRRRPSCTRCTSSSPTPRRCSTSCCRCTWRAGSSPACCSRPPRSWPAGSGR